jgi:hypothetical protein
MRRSSKLAIQFLGKSVNGLHKQDHRKFNCKKRNMSGNKCKIGSLDFPYRGLSTKAKTL